MADYQELLAQAEKAKEAAEAARKQEWPKVIAEIRRLMDLYGITVADLNMDKPATKVKRAPKFKDPDSDQTWTGVGREPRWFKSAIEKGVKEDTMRIKGA